MAYERQRNADFETGFMARLNFPDPKSPGYAAWHRQNVQGPVQEQQFQGQITAAKAHVDRARALREQGIPDRARASLARAATERSIAARMPRPGRKAKP